jgi:hypothetical protein
MYPYGSRVCRLYVVRACLNNQQAAVQCYRYVTRQVSRISVAPPACSTATGHCPLYTPTRLLKGQFDCETALFLVCRFDVVAVSGEILLADAAVIGNLLTSQGRPFTDTLSTNGQYCVESPAGTITNRHRAQATYGRGRRGEGEQ